MGVWWLYRTVQTPETTPAHGIGGVRDVDGVPYVIEPTSLLRVSAQEAIPVLIYPEHEVTASADVYLKDDGFGIDVRVGARERYYPFQILAWHEAVVDTLGDTPVLATYSPLVGLAGVFDRTLPDGTVLTFQSTDMVWNGAHVLQDQETGSLWVGGLGTAIVGPLAGQSLSSLPSVIIRWDEWKAERIQGDVLSRETIFDRDYTRDPHEGYAQSPDVRFAPEWFDARLPAKTRVYGVGSGYGSKAFTADDIEREWVISDEVGGIPFVLIADRDSGAVRAFDRRLNGRVLSFLVDDDLGVIDAQTRSAWNERGVAVSGELQRQELTPLALTPAYWFFWAATYPFTDIYVR